MRTLFRLIDGLGFYFVGFVVAVFSRQRRRIGDHAAGTVVVNDPPSAAARAGASFGVWSVVDPARGWVETELLHRADAVPVARVKPPPRTEGEIVHYRYEIHGLTFVEDRIDMEHVITDNVANATATGTGQFRMR